ncbi:MAG: isoprenylcysteine carboxylmethyltransferase family protein [Planctomycetota bacterium]
MNIALWILVLGYASLPVELVLAPVPSVASAVGQLGPARPNTRWAVRHLLPAVVAVAAFAWPAVLVVWHALSPATCPAAPAGPTLAAVGATLVVLGRAATLWAVAALRRPRPPGTCITWGPYAFSRNPALMGLHVFLLGGVTLFPAWPSLLALAVFVAHMHRRVRTEEQHLGETLGDAYARYRAHVPRYLPGTPW